MTLGAKRAGVTVRHASNEAGACELLQKHFLLVPTFQSINLDFTMKRQPSACLFNNFLSLSLAGFAMVLTVAAQNNEPNRGGNLLADAGFENPGSLAPPPDGIWQPFGRNENNTAEFSGEMVRTGDSALKTVQGPNGFPGVAQVFPIVPGEMYQGSVWVHDGDLSGPGPTMFLRLEWWDETLQRKILEEAPVSVTPDEVNGWTFMQTPVNTVGPEDAAFGKIVIFSFGSQPGTFYWDDATVHQIAPRIVPDTIIYETANDNLDNWEPFSSVLGNSVFLIEANTYAEPVQDANQRFVLAFQPVGGGDLKLGEGFFGDDGMPYLGQINASRQNGNPGRVAGDKRPGAVNFMVGGEASPHVFGAFQSGNRWDSGFDRLADGRYGTVQIFELNLESLEQTPLTTAFDAVNGRLTAGFPPGSEIGRFGGDIVALDNGNFVVAVDDRSQVRETSNSTTAVILAPNGSVVKESWVIDPRDIWSNVAAYRGGFSVRVHDTLYFHDNAGNLMGAVDQRDGLPEGVAFDTGRGDSTRIASHINTPFVFLAGQMPLIGSDGLEVWDDFGQPARVVRVAAWDSRDQSFAGQINVTELTEEHGGSDGENFFPALDRVNLAVDALNRVTVAYEARPGDWDVFFEHPQTMARVLSFGSETKEFAYLTPSFFAFFNHAEFQIRTIRPTVSMTTKEILIAAKGEINSNNQPLLGADTPTQTTFFTVLGHPDPQDDPTPRIGSAMPVLSISRSGNDISISWDGGGVLAKADVVTGPYVPMAGATSPHTTQATDRQAYFRVVLEP
jgi:hypothetical protein